MAGAAGRARPAEERMVNDIARQFGHLPPEDGAAAVAEHVRRFWDPRMRARLLALGVGGLHPLAAAAVTRLRPR